MRAKEYLSQLKHMKAKERRIDEEIWQIDATISSAPAIRYDKLNVQTSPENRLEEAIIRMEAAKISLYNLKAEYAERKAVIIKQIEALDTDLFREILLLRYVDGKAFWKISDELGYSYKYITNSHGNALREFETRWLS